MCYILLPVVAFVLLLWSTASPLFALFSTDWFVGDNGLHYGIASGCPETDSLTVPFVIPSTAQSAVTAPPSSELHAFAIWSHAGTTTTKTYYIDDGCSKQSGEETFEDGQCVVSPTAGKSFTVAINGTVAEVCMFGAADATCANAGQVTCYKRSLNKCLKNDSGMSAYKTRRRRQDTAPAAEKPAAASSPAAPAPTPAAEKPAAPAAEKPAAPAAEEKPAAPAAEKPAAPAAEKPAEPAPAASSEAPAPAPTAEAQAPAPSPSPSAAEVAAPAPAPADTTATDSSTVTFCKSMNWSYLANNVEKAMAIMCVIAGGLGVICLVAVAIEVLFRWCFKPHPIMPKVVAFFSLVQFLTLGALCICMIGYNQWTPPEGTHLGPAYWAVIIGLGAALLAWILMLLAAVAEELRYQGRFKILEQGKPAETTNLTPAQAVGLAPKDVDTESTTHILATDSGVSAYGDSAGDIEMTGGSLPPPPPPPPGARSDSRDSFD